MKLLLSLTSLSLCYSIDATAIYQYTNNAGNLVFTNKPIKNSSKVKLPPLNIYASPMSKDDLHARGYTKTPQSAMEQVLLTPAGERNNISSSNQMLMGRYHILKEELQREKLAVDDARQALISARQAPLPSEKNQPQLYQARLTALEDAVTEHQKNIEILSKQLGIND
jgi:hypothetical protein